MKNSILIKVGLFLFIIFLIAPFTFLKPPAVDIVMDSIQGEITQRQISANTPAKAKTDIKSKSIVARKVEKPLHNVSLPDFGAISDIKTKKKQFFNFLKPYVVKQNKSILATRAKLKTWIEKVTLELSLTEEEHLALDSLANDYQVNSNASTLTKLNTLLLRVDIIPMSLVLVQAANESAWGTSRFSRIGLNFFGIWCYEKGCGMVPNGRGTGEIHEVAAFNSLDDAIARYFENINTNEAYTIFRTIRYELRSQEQTLNPAILATGLLPYSERGEHYVNEITNMLRHNKEYFL